MDRRLLIVSTLLVLCGFLLMAYSDPAARAGLGLSNPTVTTPTFPRNVTGIFPGNGTGTFSFTFSRTFTGTRSFTFPSGGVTVARGGGGVVISTTTQEEALGGLGLVAVGILLEVFTLFLWEPSGPKVETPGTG
jgi:hypothetical protein